MSGASQANRAWKDEGAKRREKQEQSRNLPSRFQGGRVETRKIIIEDGNTLDTDQLGIKYSSTLIDEVPSAYDPDAGGTLIDGMGRGKLWLEGVEQEGYVLVVNDTRGSVGCALLGNNADTDGPDDCWPFRVVSIPVAGGGSVSAWVVG